jgi:hypothetical protein
LNTPFAEERESSGKVRNKTWNNDANNFQARMSHIGRCDINAKDLEAISQPSRLE